MYYNSKYDGKTINEIIVSKMKNVFLIMGTALLVTFAVSLYLILFNNVLLQAILKNMYILIIPYISISMAFTFMAYKARKMVLLALLYIYAILTGAILTIFFMVFTVNSVLAVLASTVVLFIVLGVYGYVTKQDLTKLGPLLMGGLFAIIIISLINIFTRSSLVDLMLSFLAVFIFILYTAYDVNIIKNNIRAIVSTTNDEELLDRIAIIGAFSLYLDFINLFINLLKLFGKRRD